LCSGQSTSLCAIHAGRIPANNVVREISRDCFAQDCLDAVIRAITHADGKVNLFNVAVRGLPRIWVFHLF